MLIKEIRFRGKNTDNFLFYQCKNSTFGCIPHVIKTHCNSSYTEVVEMSTGNNVDSYVYEIPYAERKELCRILDLNRDWKVLGGVHMGYRVFDIEEIENDSVRFRASATDTLLTKWGHLNHTVLELFVLLSRMGHKPAMKCLQSIVDPKYHRLIDHHSSSNRNVRRSSTGHQNQNMTTDNNNTYESNDVPAFVHHIEEGRQIQTSSKVQNGPPFEDSQTSEESKSIASATSVGLVSESAGALLMIPYGELTAATQNWDSNNILGKGGFGVVYKGDWKHTAVAIKRLKSPVSNGGGDFAESLRELKYLNACRHDNVLPLYGYSIGGEEPCLVYQLMEGGSLEDRLKCKNQRPPLNWRQRLCIAQGVAKGLQYLHTVSQKPLIHGDIKSANILLDSCNQPRIGDFGLAREGPNSDEFTHLKVSRVHGTKPYLPFEFLRGKCLSPKVDTYSFGVVVFELVTGLPAFDIRRSRRFLKDHVCEYCNTNSTNFASLQDRRLVDLGQVSPDLCINLIIVGIKCVQTKPADRPHMVSVWKELMSIQCMSPLLPEQNYNN